MPEIANFTPLIDSPTLRAYAAIFEEIGIGPFSWHIYCSIPSYFEFERAIASAIVMTYNENGGNLLDIGASEGILCKAVAHASKGRVKATALDANFSMKRNFERGLNIAGAKFLHAAVSTEEASAEYIDVTTQEAVPNYHFKKKFECIVESMFFQFLGTEREQYVKRINKSLSNDGIFICAEKFLSEDENYYIANEKIKDEYKLKFFSAEKIEEKFERILNDDGAGMGNMQVDFMFMEALLCEHFSEVVQIWDAGNFKAYACSSNKSCLKNFLDNMSDLNSPVSTCDTPQYISR